MIKLQNLDKYFNKNKSNEIHVINDISLTLPEKGLVVLLGPSGSGKTTLLNVLGGLDKVKSGAITFDDKEIKRYNSTTWDKIRNQKVGYIFQNYNLLTNLTVYDNIAITLNMIGIRDKEEIDKRVDYILDSMGMINYRKRRAFQLSGGQQQRVAIARALAKNPKVIIADEPTGNLDSKNTQDIMNIIKRISLTKLVVLVTHEEDIASSYGDRIIRLRDGEIVSDQDHSGSGSFDVQHETDIYLGDMRQSADTFDGKSDFKIYTDESDDEEINVKLIIKNKTIYVDIAALKHKKIQLLDSDSEITIKEGKYEKQTTETTVLNEFDLESIITDSPDYTKHSVFSFKDSINLAWTKMKDSRFLGMLFYLGFMAIAVLIALATGMLSGILTHNPDEFLTKPKEAVEFTLGDLEYEDIKDLVDNEFINYVQVINEVNLQAELPKVFQAGTQTYPATAPVVYAEFMDDSKMISGRVVEAYNEIVLDKQVADNILKTGSFTTLGITSYDDLEQITIKFSYISQNGSVDYEMKIVGVVDDDSPVIYMKKETAFLADYGVGIYDMFKDDLTIERGSLISASNDVISYDDPSIDDDFSLTVPSLFGEDFNLSGTYSSDKDVPVLMITAEQFTEYKFNKDYVSRFATVSLHTNNVKKALSYLNDEEELEAEGVFATQKAIYAGQTVFESRAIIIFSLVVIGISSIMYLLVIRSNLLGRIYEISVYRALGVSKWDIRMMFSTEIFLISSLTSIVGYLVTTGIMYRIQVLSEDYMDIIYISPISILAGIILIYAVNILAGLLPVSNLIRKTPAEIFSKYDF